MGAFGGSTRLRYPPVTTTSSFFYTHKSHVGSSLSSSSHSKAFGQRCGGKGTKPPYSGVLQPSLSGSQKGRHLETNPRPVSSKHLRVKRVFQDGDPVFYPPSGPPRSMGRLSGSFGRFPSRSDSSVLQKTATILPRTSCLSVPSAPLRSHHRPSDFHEAHEGGGSSFTARRLNSSPVFRRLASSPTHSSVSSGRSVAMLADSLSLGSHSQSSEVRSDSFSGFHLCRDELSDRQKRHSCTSGQDSGPTSVGLSCPDSFPAFSSLSSLPLGSLECCGRLCGTGATSFTSTPVLSFGTMAPPQGLPGCLCATTCSVSHRSPLVAERESIAQRSALGTPSSNPVSHHRCEQKRVGGTSRALGSHDIGCLEPPRDFSSYQQLGTLGSSQGCLLLSFPPGGPLCISVHGQYHSGLIHSAPRGNPQSVSVSSSSESPPSLPGPQDCSSSQILAGPSQCSGGQPLSAAADSPVGMVPPSDGCESDLCLPGSSHGGPLCHQVQSPVASVCVSGSGPSSVGSGRPVPLVGQAVRLCVPTVCSPSCSVAQSENVSVSPSPGGPPVATETMVQRPSGPTVCSSSTASVTRGPLVSERRSSASKSRPLQPSRLAVIRAGLRKKKFSSRVASLVAKARRTSTSIVYNAKWKVFSDWCAEREISSVSPSLQHIADFLVFLFLDKKLAVSTVKGYRSMLSNTLGFRGLTTIGSDPTISELIRSFELSRPVSRSLTPKWDLSCVLWSLTKAPYEPLSKASMSHLTWKTVFLLTLASAKRRSEIHALSVEGTHLRFNPDGSVTLLCQAGFLAKTQLPSVASRPFTIPSLSKDLSQSDPDRTLCPVRALRYYLDKVKPLRCSRTRLFIPVKGKHDISAASISRWIASAIRLAYSELTDQDLSFLQIRPHELRALSSSWAFVNNAPLDDILSAATWKQSSTFSTFYLRSFSASQGNLFSLGPLVAAQQVVTPGQDQ